MISNEESLELWGGNIHDFEKFLVKDIRLGNDRRTEEDIVEINYKKNDLGYRSQPFENKSKTLFLGDSFTKGDGLHDGQRYVDFLSKKLGTDFASLAQGGDSMAGQIIKCFYYFKKFGNPEQIIALFPMHRFTYPYVKDKMENLKLGQNQGQYFNTPFDNENYILSADLWLRAPEKYSKLPHTPQDVIPKQIAFFYDRVMLDMLEQYCESNNINFFWSVWLEQYQNDIYHKIEKAYPGYHKNYCWLDANLWRREGDLDLIPGNDKIVCHQEFSNDILFNIAADRMKNNGRGAHNGFHRHIHMADEFYNHIINRKNGKISIT